MPNPTNPGQAPRDLKVIAQSVAENPTIAKQMLRSKAFSSHRRAVQSKGAAASYAFGGLQKVVSFGFGQIPVPVVGSVLDKAWGIANEKARDYQLGKNIGMATSSKDQVKFSLKAIGGKMQDLDRFRWKIAHAIEQCNKAEAATGGGPCDRVVRLWAKRKYLDLRIAKLKVILAAMRGVVDATEAWLVEVEAGGQLKTDDELKSGVSAHLTNLKTGDHSTCQDVYCMFGRKEWTGQKSVPSATMDKFLIKPAGQISAVAFNDVIGDALGQI